jgi:ferric-dicitrate binding protein FerR (iron transport regulator)
MTDRHDREPVLSAADSAEVGRRVQQLAQTVQAPAALRVRLAEEHHAPAPARRRRRWVPVSAGALAAAAAVVLALVLAGGGGGPATPTVADAAAVALAGPTAAAPAVATGSETQLRAQVGGVTFPNYAYRWPQWTAAGSRRDTLHGRAATTITYRGPQGDVGYTIVDGKPLPEPDGARRVRAGGTTFAVLHRGDGSTVVTWRQGGHTCVLAGRGAGMEGQLVRFAAWA